MSQKLDDLIMYLSNNPIYKSGSENPVLRTQKILNLLGNPQNYMQVVQVIGTNGKGSTSYIIQSILKANNYKVGLYSTPHLVDFCERIRINDTNIPEKELIELIELVIKTNDDAKLEPIGFAICMTIVAILYFRKHNISIVILETGVGGIIDPTSAINPIVQVITNIGLDHTNLLGDTLHDVAYHKLGAIKPNTNVVCGVTNKEIIQLAKSYCRKLNVSVYHYGDDFYSKNLGLNKNNKFVFKILGNSIKHKIKPIELNMLGIHQIDNTCLAIKTIEVLEYYGYKIDFIELPNVIKSLTFSGRLEYIDSNVLIDASHNVDGMASLIHTLKTQFKNKKIKILASSLQNKSFQTTFKMLESISTDFYLTTLNNIHALTVPEMLEIIEYKNIDSQVQFIVNPIECYEKALAELKEDEILLMTGSFALISIFKKYNMTKQLNNLLDNN